ncbi:hypothetical protein [Actinokineospora sp. NBRC 105648]|uniref:hypothetical protein n=1 Tax=Actinokineospora sp. NBRC 105648 TaxID=3032206 RepID=UPI0024A15AB9|nr:hypothetical protein [Actinokineospora sp. NBRC 105648]GLZ39829.1 hypothetical protein Acsp05_34530 [Actinokineospora sp. NBRC 105648]
MSIQDQAQELANLADRLPAGQVQSINNELNTALGQVTHLLGNTTSAATVQQSIGRAQSLAADLGAAIEQAQNDITTAAQHHLSG